MFRNKFLGIVLLVGMLISQSVPRAFAATGCDQAQFVSDLTVPDGSSFAPGSTFTKTWRLMNIGTCGWTTGYNLVWAGGDLAGAPLSVRLPVDVAPGQMVDLSVNLTAPPTGGHYKSLFKISNISGAQFGIGASASDPFWADFNVVEVKAVIYDFLANAPYAQWKSGAGILPFPGTSGDSRGFAYQVDNPHLEDDSFDAAPGLLVVPQNKFSGYIQAMYPEFQVQQGDRLQTLVNCEFGATGCYVTFRIDYLLSNGAQKTLWSWKEAYDKRFYRADIDLSSLAGQKVRFIFMLLSTGFASGDRALWGSPRILRTGTTQPPAPPATLTPLPSLPATATPLGQPPPTIQPSGCNRAIFVTDVTVQDGTSFTPGAAFTKTWRLKNAGICPWTTAYKLVYYSGEQMSAPTTVNLPWSAGFDRTVDISVNMVAPLTAGNYRGYWILANASGQFFGIGADASRPVWVEINVVGDPAAGTSYDFTSNVCSAEWKSGAGGLPCPGTDGSSSGFIVKLDSPKLEDGSTGNPGLLTVPQNRFNGYIQGFYPTFTVQPGDKFQSTVGCEFGAAGCYVTFRLDYMTPSGYIGTFWQWREQNDGKYYAADVDLTPLAGRSVRFILTTLATGSATTDRAVWAAPRILRANTTPPTITPVSPTVSPPLVSSPGIRQLFMFDSANGWGIGGAYAVRTFDGGATWYNMTATGVSGNITSGYFPNSSTGWIITDFSESNIGSLYYTTNGGSSWTHYNTPFTSGYIQFVDSVHGFVMPILGAAMNKQAVALYQTSDGGATWVRNYINDPTVPGAANSLPLGGHKNGMTFRDPSTGWVGGEIPVDGFVYLYKTTDGGFNWSPQALALPAGYESAFLKTTAPTFFGANDAILPVWMTIGMGMRDLFLYVTHDGGATWIRSSAFARNGDFVSFPSVRDALSWDRADLFHVTNDAGVNWRSVTPNVLFSKMMYQVFDLEFVSPTAGWFAIGHDDGSTSLYRTGDGGATWTLLFGKPPVTQILPDLTITGMNIQLQNPGCLMPGDPLGIRIGITNNGQAAAGSFVVRVNNVDQTVNGLGIGETTVLFFAGSANPVNAVVDATGLVAESDENNNTRSEMVPVPTPPLPCNNPAEFLGTIVNRLNARNFDAVKASLDQQFTFAYWQSQGTSYPPDLAIDGLRNNLSTSTPLVPDANKDLAALLDGSNPYSIMGLDPAKSQALFVSGWGQDGSSEAIFYVTRRPDGSLYFHSVLIAPGGFARFVTSTPTPTPTPAPLQGPYAVMRVAPNDVLNIRSGPGVSNSVIGYYPPDATDVMRTGVSTSADGAVWVEVRRGDGLTGWVNFDYLTEHISTAAFCADGRIPPLIEQLKQSLIQSNGDQFAALIGSKHGAAINFWRDVPPVNFTTTTARGIFTDPSVYDWGTGPAAGPSGEHGTFAQIIQPDMLEVFNSGYQLGCDDPSHAGMFMNPWPYTNIHYYSILKPPTDNMFDWKVWLVGFEYVDGVPYLYGAIHYVWEP